MPANALWMNRIQRLGSRIALLTSDLERMAGWYAGGGRRYYGRFSGEIINNHNWCFIVGCNNSGTSLLQSMLEKSGKVSTLQREGQHYTNVLPRGSRKGHERVWSEFIDELRLLEDSPKSIVPQLLHDWMREFEKPVKETIVEKTTLNACRMRWLQEVFPKSRFVGVVRNGYAVVEGIRRKGHKDVVRGARHWNLVNKIMIEDARKINNFLIVRYEDMIHRQKETIEQLAEFIGLELSDFDEAMEAEYSFATVSGSGSQSIRDFNQDSIRRLSKEDVDAIHREAQEMLTYFNYSVTGAG